MCSCASCQQMGLYDPAPKRQKAEAPPRAWFKAMLEGIRKRSDVRSPAGIMNTGNVLTPSTRARIKAKAQKGEPFKYDLPLPEDHGTRGTGIIRMIKPFNLVEGQANVSKPVWERLSRSGLFSRMKRQDGSTCLVKRCKSAKGNVDIFVDKA